MTKSNFLYQRDEKWKENHPVLQVRVIQSAKSVRIVSGALWTLCQSMSGPLRFFFQIFWSIFRGRAGRFYDFCGILAVLFYRCRFRPIFDGFRQKCIRPFLSARTSYPKSHFSFFDYDEFCLPSRRKHVKFTENRRFRPLFDGFRQKFIKPFLFARKRYIE